MRLKLIGLAMASMVSAPANAVTPVSGSLHASIDVFTADGDVHDNAIGQDGWASGPRNLSHEIQAVAFAQNIGIADGRAMDSAAWSADGRSGSVRFDWTWFLSNAGSTLVGASFADSVPNWTYTFTADRDGRLIWEGQVRPGGPLGGAPNQPFGLTGWDLTLNGQTVVSLIDPNHYTSRTGDRDFDLTAGETYTFALVNNSNIAGRNFQTSPFYRGNFVGEFYWLIQEDAVPEPSSWALLILGFGMAGGICRRGRSGQIAPAKAG